MAKLYPLVIAFLAVAGGAIVAVRHARSEHPTSQNASIATSDTTHGDAIGLRLDDDAEAAHEFAELTGSHDAAARLALARHYMISVPELAAFYQTTIDVSAGGRERPAAPSAITNYQCDAEIGPGSRQTYLDLSDRFAFAEPKELGGFVEAVDSAMKRYGHSCDLAGLWAQAVLRESEWTPDAYPIATQETAVRILFAVGESFRPFHEREPSPELFLLLSGYFDVARHDAISAYVALTWAEERLQAATLPSKLRTKYEMTISRRKAAISSKIEKLKSRQR